MQYFESGIAIAAVFGGLVSLLANIAATLLKAKRASKIVIRHNNKEVRFEVTGLTSQQIEEMLKKVKADEPSKQSLDE